MVSDFYDYPDLYDALLPVGAEVPFYVDLAQQQAGAVLELACGTGQLTIPIALQRSSDRGTRSVKRHADRREKASVSNWCVGGVRPERHA